MDTKSAPVSRSRRPPRPARGRMIRVRVSDEEYTALAEKGAAVGGMSKLLRDHLGTIWVRHRDDERQRLTTLNRINANLDKTPCGRTWGTSIGLQGPARCAVEA